MKKLFFIIIFFISLVSYSQRDINYNFTINTTFTVNENFGGYDEYADDMDWALIVPRAVLFHNGIDVKLNNFISTGINLGLDWHPDIDVLAIPYYLDSKFALVRVDDDKFYIGGGIGKLLKLGKAFERGSYYKAGIGYHIATESSYNFMLNVDFHQKKIADFENGRLNSFSFGFGMFFL